MDIKQTLIMGFVTLAFMSPSLAQTSFMSYSNSSGNASNAATAPGGAAPQPMSPQDFKSMVKSLGEQNQAELNQQVQQMTPPASNMPTQTPVTNPAPASNPTYGSGTQAPAPAQPAPSSSGYTGFGTGTSPSGSSPSSGSSSGFGVNY